MIPLEKSEAETRERGAVLSPSCAQRKCIFFVAQGGSASRGRRSPLSKKRFATLGSFSRIPSSALRSGRWPPVRLLSGGSPPFSSSLSCPFLHSAPILDATRPSPEASAIAKDMPRQAPSAMRNSRPRRRPHAMHAAARCEGRPRNEATAGDGRRCADASFFSIPTVRNASSRGSLWKRRTWITSSLTGDARSFSSMRRTFRRFAMSATLGRLPRRTAASGIERNDVFGYARSCRV